MSALFWIAVVLAIVGLIVGAARVLWLLDREYWSKYDGMIRAADRIRDRYGERVLTWARLVRRASNPQMLSHKIAGLSWQEKKRN